MFGHSQSHSHIRRSPQVRPTFAGLRRYNRRPLETQVVIQDEEGWEIPLDSVDISPTGIFVRSDFLFEIGDEHTLIFHVEGRGIFRVRGRVARVEEPGEEELLVPAEQGAGMGYEFLDTEEQMWHELCEVVAGM